MSKSYKKYTNIYCIVINGIQYTDIFVCDIHQCDYFGLDSD